MLHRTLEDCLLDLEKNKMLLRVTEPIDPNLEMAALHLRVFEMGGPALLFEQVIGSDYRAASNIFGNLERSKFLFRHTMEQTQKVIALKGDPMSVLKKPFQNLGTAWAASKALPKRLRNVPTNFKKIKITDIPQIKHWAMDGGAFITLPQVFSEDIDKPGLMNANLGMYRVQLSGNQYIPNEEVGLHYQIHRGIGVHQSKANGKGQPLKVSIFVGGPPAHTLSAVMPLPEGLSELTFAGLLAGRRFRYAYDEGGYCISADADFVITGDIHPRDVKPEGPFGDHLGYYSLTHPFPVMKVKNVYAKQDAIWPFTVVGRPPQEDTAFGDLIHEMTGDAIPSEIPGVKEVHAVDAAGVHPLLFAIGSERYTPYMSTKQPMEILTLANRILGTGQLSLAKYLFITAKDSKPISTHKEAAFLQYILERINLKRDIHFQTNTTIDTLDYSGTGLNTGSKVIFAAYGGVCRSLGKQIPAIFQEIRGFNNPQLIMPGIIALQTASFQSYQQLSTEMQQLQYALGQHPALKDFPLIILCDDASFLAANFKNFLWATFTRSNPSHDIHGINSYYENKHWGCDAVIIDARTKPHHAPALIEDPEVEEKINRFFVNGASLSRLKNKF
jgi:4-hydroxy-3-polyprenylbenzoate decarboxylase